MDVILHLTKVVVIIVALIHLSELDVKRRKVPNQVLLFLLCARCGIAVFEFVFLPLDVSFAAFFDSLIGMLVIGGPLTLLALFAKGSIGMGDAKLYGVIGLFLGWYLTVTSAVLAFMCGALYSLYLVAAKKGSKKVTYPFVPFILLGTALASICSFILNF